MRPKFFPFLLLALMFFGCNKEVEFSTSLPFAVFPNPCRGQVSAIYTGGPASSVEFNFYDRSGALILHRQDFANGQILTLALPEKGIYYIEVIVNGTSFKEEILNLG